MEGCIDGRRSLAEELGKFRKLFTALGDETRLMIMITLLENEKLGMRVPELTMHTHLSRPAVSHHLQVLREVGLVAVHRVGTKNYYYLDVSSGCWDELRAFIDHTADTVAAARAAGYPYFTEDEEP